jgi:hypothetical protein
LYLSSAKAIKVSYVEKEILNYSETSYDVSVESGKKWRKLLEV